MAPIDPSESTISRRRLVTGLGLLAAAGASGFTGLRVLTGNAEAPPEVVGRLPVGFEPTQWSDPRSWPDGRVPGPTEIAVIERPIIAQGDLSVAGIEIRRSGVLVLSPHASTSIESRGNVIVEGQLVMRPIDPSTTHVLRFVDVDESKFVGGGMEVLSTDVGLWITEHGLLDAHGSTKLPWTRAAVDLNAGDTVITCDEELHGWQPGDQLAITPTRDPAVEPEVWKGYDDVKVLAVDGNTVTLDRPLEVDHPVVEPGKGRRFGAEVLNLSRNAIIGGTPDGRAHVVFLHGQHHPQHISHLRIEHTGPNRSGPVLGRYGLHFHHCGDGSTGSTVDGVVVLDGGNHAFVPHESNGITFTGCIADRTALAQYWWDGQDESSHITYDRCVGSRMFVTAAKESRIGVFDHRRGEPLTNVTRNCVAVGAITERDGCGYFWGSDTTGVWVFEDNVAHNLRQHGIFVWTNTSRTHPIDRFTAYNVRNNGVDHGAYNNNFTYTDAVLYRCRNRPVAVHSLSRLASGQQVWTDCLFDATGTEHAFAIGRHATSRKDVVLVLRCEFVGAAVSHVAVRQGTSDDFGGEHDFVDCTFAPDVPEFRMGQVRSSAQWRVQDDVRGTIALRRADQGGTYHPEWDAGVHQIDPFYKA